MSHDHCLALGRTSFRVALLFVGGLVAFAQSANAAPKKAEYVFLMGSSPQYAPNIVGVRKGFCSKLGLNVNFKLFTSGMVASQSFLAGEGDFVNTAEWPALSLWRTTAGRVVGIQPTIRSFGVEVVVAKSDLKTPADLKGKKIAVWMGTTSEYFAKLVLNKYQIPVADVQFVNVQPVEMISAMDKGDVDAFVMWQPTPWRSLEVSGSKVHFIENSEKYYSSYQITSARKELFDSDPDAVKAFLICTRQGGEYAKANPDEAAKIVSQEIKTPVELVRKMFDLMDLTVPYDGRFRKDMEGVNNFMMAKDTSPHRVDWDKEFDQRPLRDIDPALAQ